MNQYELVFGIFGIVDISGNLNSSLQNKNKRQFTGISNPN